MSTTDQLSLALRRHGRHVLVPARTAKRDLTVATMPSDQYQLQVPAEKALAQSEGFLFEHTGESTVRNAKSRGIVEARQSSGARRGAVPSPHLQGICNVSSFDGLLPSHCPHAGVFHFGYIFDDACRGVVVGCYGTDLDGAPRVELEIASARRMGHTAPLRAAEPRSSGRPPICWHLHDCWCSASRPGVCSLCDQKTQCACAGN